MSSVTVCFWFCICLCLIRCFNVFEFLFLVFYFLGSVLMTVLFYCIFRYVVLPVFWFPGCVLQFVSLSSSSMSSFVSVCFTCSVCLPVSTSHLFPVFLITCPIVSGSPSSLFRSVLPFVPRSDVMSFCRVLWILALLQILLGSVLEDICTPPLLACK
ncbi:hypothetical protein GOODEAATRI_006124 [Goodea atripinnis]|uniref:NADH dehydrogenase subunit 6 n=1 Tax=Goodea atripinnis TaxID=208336 RepID=A0ABV0N8D9_9TELE